MLEQFNFSNFKSFRDETTFDLTATNITAHQNRVYVEDINNGEKLLVITGIFGANSSGKSNLIKALKFMQSFVLHSGLNSIDSNDQFKNFQPYLFRKDASKQDSEFEIFYLDRDSHVEYNYGFLLNSNEVREEWLYCKKSNLLNTNSKEIFHRDGDNLSFTEDLSLINENDRELIKEELIPQSLILTLGSHFNVSVLNNVYSWFNSLIFQNAGMENRTDDFPQDLFYKLENGELNKDELVQFLKSVEPRIQDIEIQSKELGQPSTVNIAFVDKEGIKYKIPYRDESSGFHKMTALFTALNDSIKNGKILIIDDFDNHIHPSLMRALIYSFINPSININHAQLIFTTHNPLLLEQLRRDEIWFLDKSNKKHTSLLYSLVDFVDYNEILEKGENNIKNYLVGKFGAVPLITDAII